MAAILHKDLAAIRDFYYNHKFNARQIAEKFNVSIDAVYYFMRHNNLSRRTFHEDNKLRFERKPPSFNLKTKLNGGDEKLKAIGVALYWGEGYKAEKSFGIDFANSDPEMIKTFLKFLRDICGINESRLRILLYCYSNQKIDKLKTFWSKESGIPKHQFSKPYVRKDFRAGKENKMPFGLVHVRYMDKKLLILMRCWIEEYKYQFAQVDP